MKIKEDYSVNCYNLKYDERYRRFYFPSQESRKVFRAQLAKKLFQSEKKINCNENDFSAKDQMSAKFINSELYELMLESLNIKNSKELIKKLNGFSKMDINYDEYYSNKTLFHLIKDDPCSYANRSTPVCYIYKPIFHDEMYDYTLYVKLNANNNQVNVMSLHWNDVKFPNKIWNRQRNDYDDIEEAVKYLRSKRDSKDYER